MLLDLIARVVERLEGIRDAHLATRGRGRGEDREAPGDRYHDGGRAAGTLRDAVPPAVL